MEYPSEQAWVAAVWFWESYFHSWPHLWVCKFKGLKLEEIQIVSSTSLKTFNGVTLDLESKQVPHVGPFGWTFHYGSSDFPSWCDCPCVSTKGLASGFWTTEYGQGDGASGPSLITKPPSLLSYA